MAGCGGDLPEFWYRDAETLARELEAHDGYRGAEAAHGVSNSTLVKWARKLDVVPSKPNHGRRRTDVKRARATGVVTREELLEEEIRELRREASDRRKIEVYEERVLGILEGSLEARRPRYSRPKRANSNGFTAHEFFLPWSDLHSCERVSREQTNGLNEYDWDTMVRRHWRLSDSILSFRKNRPYPVHKLTIAPLGDMVSGDIHDELRETNEKVLAEAAISTGEFAADWIEESFVPEFSEVVIDGCVTGNHGRRSKKPQAKNVHDSFDWIVYEIIRIRLAKYEHVKVNVPRAAHAFITVAGKRILCFHGDGIRTTMVGVPWGGITRRVKELAEQYEPAFGRIDHFVLGHWHEAHVVKNRRIIVNGCVKGPDEYGIARGMSAPATQVLTTFHPRRGLTDVSFLDLQDA